MYASAGPLNSNSYDWTHDMYTLVGPIDNSDYDGTHEMYTLVGLMIMTEPCNVHPRRLY